MAAPALPTVGITTDAPAPALTHRLGQLAALVPVSRLATCRGEIDGLILLPDADDHNGAAARALTAAHPGLPEVTAAELTDATGLAHFLMRIEAHAAWRALRMASLTQGALVDFHSRYKYQLMACSPAAYRALGQRLGQRTGQPDAAFAQGYFVDLMAALRDPPTPGLHCNVLMHLGGYFRRHLDATERQALERCILAYRDGAVPLTEPLARLRQHLEEYPNPYLSRQVYLQPYLERVSG